MDSRTWFLLQREKLPLPELGAEIPRWIERYCPHSAYRCPEVMEVFQAGLRSNFRLIDEKGQPTDALRVMVRDMGVVLCQAEDLAPEEKRHFTHHKGVIDPVFKDRWFIRDISRRLRNDCHWWTTSGNSYCGGTYWNMFKTDKNLGLLYKDRVTQLVDGEKLRTHLWLVACPPNWELSDDVYCGLYRWHGYHVRHHAWAAIHIWPS